MNIANLIVNGIAAMSFLLIGGFLCSMIAVYAERRLQDGIAPRFAASRMARMMQRLGLARSAYLYQEPPREIARRLDGCAACAAVERCEQTLAGVSDDTSFCANRDMLAQRQRLDALR